MLDVVSIRKRLRSSGLQCACFRTNHALGGYGDAGAYTNITDARCWALNVTHQYSLNLFGSCEAGLFGSPSSGGGDASHYIVVSFITPISTTVMTLPATAIAAASATLNGTVNPNGWPTTAWFQWGTTTNYGNLTGATDLGSGWTTLPLSAPLTSLTPGTTYHFRAAATNIVGVVYGSDQSFTAAPSPPEVWTFPATAVTPTNATLNGMVNPNGWPTTAWFQWGATTNYGNLTSVTSLGSGTAALPLSAPLAGLTLGTPTISGPRRTTSPGLFTGVTRA